MVSPTSERAVIARIVQDQPGLDKRQIATLLRAEGLLIGPLNVNIILYGAPSCFEWKLERKPSGGERRAWYPVQPLSRAAINFRQSTIDTMLRILRERQAPDHFIDTLYP